MSDSAVVEKKAPTPYSNPDPLNVVDGTNGSLIVCPYCSSKILLKGDSTYIKKDLFLHLTNTSASEQKGETLSDHFLVDDKFKFYNIGVSRSVHKKAPAKTDTKVEEATEAKEKETKNTSNNDNNTSDDDSTKSNPYGDREFKYLTCCDCERGPLGITFVDDPNNFYVSHKRIRYE